MARTDSNRRYGSGSEDECVADADGSMALFLDLQTMLQNFSGSIHRPWPRHALR